MHSLHYSPRVLFNEHHGYIDPEHRKTMIFVFFKNDNFGLFWKITEMENSHHFLDFQNGPKSVMF